MISSTVTHLICNSRQSLLCLRLLGNRVCSRSPFGVRSCTGYLNFPHIGNQCSPGCTHPRCMLLDTDSPGLEAVDTIRTRLHTLNTDYPGNWGKSPHLGSASLVADGSSSQSPSACHSWENLLTGGMKPAGGGGIGIMGIIGTPPPLPNC